MDRDYVPRLVCHALCPTSHALCICLPSFSLFDVFIQALKGACKDAYAIVKASDGGVDEWLSANCLGPASAAPDPKKFNAMKELMSKGSQYPPGPYLKFYDQDQKKLPKPALYSDACACIDQRLCWHCLPDHWSGDAGRAANAVKASKLKVLLGQRILEAKASTTKASMNASTALMKTSQAGSTGAAEYSLVQFEVAKALCFVNTLRVPKEQLSSKPVCMVMSEPLMLQTMLDFVHACNLHDQARRDYQCMSKQRERKTSIDATQLELGEGIIRCVLRDMSKLDLDTGSWADQHRAVIALKELDGRLMATLLKLTIAYKPITQRYKHLFNQNAKRNSPGAALQVSLKSAVKIYCNNDHSLSWDVAFQHK